MMLHKEKIDSFWKRRTEIKDAKIAANYRDDGRLAYDAEWVRQWIKPESKILDLGAGTCQLSLQLLDLASKILAVEKHESFFDLVPDHPNLIKHQADILEFSSIEQFDVILIFGVINFISETEELTLYKKCHALLKSGGFLLVKNQCGIHKELIIDSYSEALRDHYHARYPEVDHQQKLLTHYFNVKRFDIYPAHLNLWKDTHFYAFSAEKSE